MKKLVCLLLTSLLLLSACGDNEKKEDKKEDKKTHTQSNKKSSNNNEHKETKPADLEKDDEEQITTTDNKTNEQAQLNTNQNNQQPQPSQQQSFDHEPTKEEIYELDKQNIPGGTDAGLIDYDEYNRLMKEEELAQEKKEAALQKEYFELSDKMAEDNVSEEEYKDMEKRQDEILDQVQSID
ncbi:hypothetical protein [Staphylococcus coagulans]|uniref:hypothetical protein n=1 Tax=Staphylococcus coagulans TaxID=74706 RepID=UPI0033652D39